MGHKAVDCPSKGRHTVKPRLYAHRRISTQNIRRGEEHREYDDQPLAQLWDSQRGHRDAITVHITLCEQLGPLPLELPRERLLRLRAMTTMHLRQVEMQDSALRLLTKSGTAPERQIAHYSEAISRLQHRLRRCQGHLDAASAVEDNPPPMAPPLGPLPIPIVSNDHQKIASPEAKDPSPPSHRPPSYSPPRSTRRQQQRKAAAKAYEFHLAALQYAHDKFANRAHSICSTSSESSQGPFQKRPVYNQQSEWLRDLTAEGVEPNPGPPKMNAFFNPKNSRTPGEDTTLQPNETQEDTHSTSMEIDNPLGNLTMDPENFQEQAKNWPLENQGRYGPIIRRLPTGLWFEERELICSTLQLLAQEVQQVAVDNLFSGDGLPNQNNPPSTKVFHLFNQQQMTVHTLIGKHTLICFPKPLPFSDQEPVFSFRSWCNLFKQALMDPTSKNTRISLIFTSRYQSPNPKILPLLDRRFELEPLRRFLFKISVLPDLQLDKRNPETGAIEQVRTYRQFPLMLYAFRNALHMPIFEINAVWSPSKEMDIPPFSMEEDGEVFHVLVNCENAIALPPDSGREMSALRLLMIMNQMDPSETTSQFRGATYLRYPPSPLPQFQRASPDGFSIVHYHVPQKIINFLEEDREDLRGSGISWILLPNDLQGMYVISHIPKRTTPVKKTTKSQASEIRDAIMAAPSIATLLDFVIILNRWEVLTRPIEGVNIPMLADALRNLENYTLADAQRLQKVYPNSASQVCDPPQVLVFYPLHMSVEYVLRCVSMISSLQYHQDFGNPGVLLVTLQSADHAPLLYGLTIQTGKGSIAFTSGMEEKDAQAESSLGLKRNAPLLDRKPLLEAGVNKEGKPPLTITNLKAHDLGNE